jgi:lysophospholipase L1-like esterase
MAKFILGAVLALVLTACGGGGGDAPMPPTKTPAAPPAPTCTPRTVSVALVGDSTLYGFLVLTGAQATDNPGVRLQNDMDAEFGAGSVVVTNYAVSGTTSAQASKVAADVIVTNYGINDAHLGVPVADYITNMRAIGATLIETPNPTWGTVYGAIDDAPYAAAGRTLGLPVADTQAYMLARQGWQDLLPDGVHPTEAGYVEIVDNVLAPAVAKQVAPLRCVKG